jgi:hypothetical protein
MGRAEPAREIAPGRSDKPAIASRSPLQIQPETRVDIDIKTFPESGMSFVLAPWNATLLQYREICAALKNAKEKSASTATIAVLPPGTEVQNLSDEDLAQIGLQRIQKADA